MKDAVMEPYPKTALTRRPVSIFCSYAHSDERFRVELDKHLSVMRRNGEINEWHDRNISAGTEWKNSIDRHLNAAEIILLLVSADFLASDYCYEIEMTRAMERHELGKACVIPIILRDCDWSSAPFSKLQALPRDAKPIKKWSNQDEAYHDIVVGIRNVIGRLRASKKQARPTRKTLLVVAVLSLILFGVASYLTVTQFARPTDATNQPAGKPEQTPVAIQSAEKAAAPSPVPETLIWYFREPLTGPDARGKRPVSSSPATNNAGSAPPPLATPSIYGNIRKVQMPTSGQATAGVNSNQVGVPTPTPVTFVLSSRVFDGERPVKGARVSIVGSPEQGTVETDGNGSFSFSFAGDRKKLNEKVQIRVEHDGKTKDFPFTIGSYPQMLYLRRTK
jgi:hypothetical protein